MMDAQGKQDTLKNDELVVLIQQEIVQMRSVDTHATVCLVTSGLGVKLI